MLPRLTLFLLILCLPVMGQRKDKPAASDDKGGTNAPPVKAQEVRVMRGQSVVIKLTGTTGTNRDMTFLIREAPKLGKFKEEKPVSQADKVSATITYTSDPKSKGNKDTFTFAAQVPGSSVGDPATVTIHISDPSVKLDFVETLDAKRLLLGQPAERTFLLRNAGDARWQAKIEPPPGWKWILPEDGAFDLGPGKEINARISCLAQKVGALKEVIEFAPGKKLTCVATVIPPFTLLNSSVAMEWQKQSRSRTGTLEINNLDPARSLTIQLSGPPWLKVDPEFTLAADQKVPLPLSSSTELGKKLSGKLKISVGSYFEEVPVTAPASPAVFSIRKGLDEYMGFHFGKLTAASLATDKRPFTVTNDGGTAGTLKIEPPKFFRLEPAPPAEGIPLAPGEEAKFTVLPPLTVAGTHESTMNLTGGDDVVTVRCSANIDPAQIAKTTGELAGLYLEKNRENIPRPRTRNEAEKETKLSNSGVFPVDGKEDKTIPTVDVVEVAEDTGEQVTFAWDLPPGDGWKFLLYRATIQRLKSAADPTKVGAYVKVFEPCGDEVKYTVEGRRATATVPGLSPHMPFNFCIQTIGPDGRKSLAGQPITYRPYPADPSHWARFREWYFGCSALVIALCWWGWKKWKEPLSASA